MVGRPSRNAHDKSVRRRGCPMTFHALAAGACSARTASSSARVVGSTKSAITATPRTATTKLATKSTSNAPRIRARSRNATTGPMNAPAASSARWTPNAVARSSDRLRSEMSASRGAVRRPLPMRSIATTPAIVVQAAPAAMIEQPAGGRDAVADRGQLLVLARAIGEHAAEDSHERGRPLVQAVDQAERHGTDPELEDEIHRKNARHHFRRDVRQQAREAERPDRGADPLQPGPLEMRRGSRRTLPRESENRSPDDRVHERTV